MKLVRKLRLWRAAIFGPHILQWEVPEPDGTGLRRRRLLLDGNYEYRPVTAAEEKEYLEATAW